jgi:UDP-N-acetyl-2-amino-2-deoxyglucuronate dehydrogenase
MDKIKFALVGCGSIAKKHVYAIRNYVKDAEIVAFCDINLVRAKEFAEGKNTLAFSNVKEMMDTVGDKIDIVNVLTPSGTHAQNVVELVEYGKPLVIEKPIALRLEESDEIIRACDAHGVKIFVVHQNRFNLPIRKAH